MPCPVFVFEFCSSLKMCPSTVVLVGPSAILLRLNPELPLLWAPVAHISHPRDLLVGSGSGEVALLHKGDLKTIKYVQCFGDCLCVKRFALYASKSTATGQQVFNCRSANAK